ncbi:High-affinity glucose transporter [Pseudocercospora fuligena]|uniref:High-affinity glucose transporter n=1 Tax=Pseudocercospora fuligena TaxID=685502 RepID=A0A8H6RLD8_9PEZI|nr:High-affinity glucose transporter [Pseudocercospora fuligena]
MFRFTNIYVLAAFGTIGGALFGFDVSSMSAWLGTEQYTEYFNNPGSNLQGGITASMSGGSFIGAIAAGFLADKLGRKIALQIACCIFVVGCAIVCSSQNVGQLIAGRIINGLAIGICSSQVCVYLAELSPGAIRGRIVGIQQWAIEWGILIMYLICYGCARSITGPTAFRVAWGVQGIPAIILFAALFFFPESPRWLAGQERWEECLDVLADLHGKGDRNNAVVLAEYEEVREAQRIAAEAQGVGFVQLFGPRIWKRTVAGCSVQMWQQLLGGNVAMYYVVYIFQMAGLSGNVNLYSSAIQYVIFLVTTGVMLPIIDRIGRRQLLIGGAIICMVLHYTTAAVMATYGRSVDSVFGNDNLKLELSPTPGKAVIALSYIFTGIYGLTWAPTGWIYCSEVFPLKYRAKGVGLSAATNWIFNFALAYFLPPAFKNITWKTYIVFGVFCTVMTVHIFFTYPETARKTLEEIDLLFDSKIPAWKSGKVQANALETRAQKIEQGVETDENGLEIEKEKEGDVKQKEVV